MQSRKKYCSNKIPGSNMYVTNDTYIFVTLGVRHSQYRAFRFKCKDELKKTCSVTLPSS